MTDAVAIAIALVSLSVSAWVVLRDRKDRRLDLLYQCYDRLQRTRLEQPFVSVEQLIQMDEDPDNPDHDEYRERARDAQANVDRELEFACYLVVAKEIDLDMFFDLFRG